MANLEVMRQSALKANINQESSHTYVDEGISIVEIPNLSLRQLVVWPGTRAAVTRRLVERYGSTHGALWWSVGSRDQAVLRLDPLRFWLVGANNFEISAGEGATLDLSHSRSRVRLTGDNARFTLNRQIPLDLRDAAFPSGKVASTVMHGIGVTVWRNEAAFDLFLPRSFARSLHELLR